MAAKLVEKVVCFTPESWEAANATRTKEGDANTAGGLGRYAGLAYGRSNPNTPWSHEGRHFRMITWPSPYFTNRIEKTLHRQ